MIQNLIIKNYIIVEDLTISLHDGLQILTGETGAGKSILLGALNIILGSSLKSGILMNPDKKAYLEASFLVKENKEVLKLMADLEFDNDDNELFITKEISPNLKGKSFINGRRVTNQIVKQFREVLFDFHSQRDQVMLFNPQYQLSLLDQYGTHQKTLKAYQNLFSLSHQTAKELIAKEKQEQDMREKIQLYEFQSTELEEASLKIGEMDEIKHELNLLQNSHEILKLSTDFEFELYEKDHSIFEILKQYSNRLSTYIEDHGIIKNTYELLDECTNSLELAVQEMQQLEDAINIDPQRKQFLEERLDLLNSLETKYHKTVPELIEYWKEISAYIQNAKSSKKELDALKQKKEKLFHDAFQKAVKLSSMRRKSAQKMQQEIVQNIRRLAVPDARFDIQFDSNLEDLRNSFSEHLMTKDGVDTIQFCFAANKGKELQLIKDAASGGELSRLLLTMKKILADQNDKKIIIFDEIDSGVGGKTAEYLGEFIAEIAKSHQILCITHLPQVASFAQNHYLIHKDNSEKVTKMNIQELENQQRVDEIARMLSGSNTEIALVHANELIEKNTQK